MKREFAVGVTAPEDDPSPILQEGRSTNYGSVRGEGFVDQVLW